MRNEGKEKILEAARNVISEFGIQGATVRSIAKEAGLSTGAIYHYYASKEAILYDVMDDGLGEIKRISTISIEHQKRLEEIVYEIYEGMQERFQKEEESRLQFYLAHEAILGNKELQHKFKEKYDEWIGSIESIFIQAYDIEAGPLTRAVATWTMAGIDGIIMQMLLRTESIDITHVNRVLEYLLKVGFPHFLEVIHQEEE